MESLREVSFTDALSRLQAMLGDRVRVEENHYTRFYGVAIEAGLERVETLPPDNNAIRIVLDNEAEFYLDPDEVRTYLGGGFAVGPTWIEFRFPQGPTLLMEHEPRDEPGASDHGE